MRKATTFSDIAFRSTSDASVCDPSGSLHYFTAGDTLLVGDAVFLSAANTVNKSATASNYVGFVGFVESGSVLDNYIGHPVGTQAATTGKTVLVRTSGIARAIVGASGFIAGTNFNAVPSAATAGRVIPGTTADQRLGTVLTTQASAGAEVKILISRM